MRHGVLWLAFAASALYAPGALAQLFSDDAAREQTRKNYEEIETIKNLLRDLNQSVIQLEKARQQAAVLAQKNQEMEAQIGQLNGKLQETEKALRDVNSNKDAQHNQQKIAIDDLNLLIADLRQQIDEFKASHDELKLSQDELKVALEEISEFVTLPSEHEIYTAAYGAYHGGDISGAIVSFRKLLNFYPEGQFAPNAYYWLSEAYLLEGNYTAAYDNAAVAINAYRDSDRRPATMLVLARALESLGDSEQARLKLEEIISEYPTSLAADTARQLLAR